MLLAAAASFRFFWLCGLCVRTCLFLVATHVFVAFAFRVCFAPVAVAYVCGSFDEFHVLSPLCCVLISA